MSTEILRSSDAAGDNGSSSLTVPAIANYHFPGKAGKKNSLKIEDHTKPNKDKDEDYTTRTKKTATKRTTRIRDDEDDEDDEDGDDDDDDVHDDGDADGDS
ncbi:hypothetical protein AK812_SmicGene10057 [Symbiodinium microadriaticum]|uniref:Uncharacterized protein n=1 Tax=Symbiodinium microadriaticum TaxID=2951 RepID=A0A1Q9EH08_SYMMI|nr:hypothetical protein AK812_SmicGene10057 [Symbiodinium microadriaticum]